jgi:hypothetical protein
LYYSTDYGKTFNIVPSKTLNYPSNFQSGNMYGIAISPNGKSVYVANRFVNVPGISSTTTVRIYKSYCDDTFSTDEYGNMCISVNGNLSGNSVNQSLVLGTTSLQGNAYANLNMTGNSLVYSGIYFQDGTFQNSASSFENYKIPMNGFGSNYSSTRDISATSFVQLSKMLAVSANGKYIALAKEDGTGRPVHLSSDYGNTWTTLATQIYSTGFVMSETGQYMAYGGSDGTSFLFSNDYGASFSTIYTFDTIGGIYAMSKNGQYITRSTNVYADKAYWYVSSNFGRTWKKTTNILPNPTGGLLGGSVSMSGDGKYQIIYRSINDNVVGMLYSNNFGNNFTYRTFSSVSTSYAYSCMISYTGKYMILTTTVGIYYSNNYGYSWNLSSSYSATSFNVPYWATGMSNSGQYAGITHYNNGNVYFTYDYGVTWYITTDTIYSSYAATYGVFISDDAMRMYMTASTGSVQRMLIYNHDCQNMSYTGSATSLATSGTNYQIGLTALLGPGIWNLQYCAQFNVTSALTSTKYIVGFATTTAVTPTLAIQSSGASVSYTVQSPALIVSGSCIVTLTTATTYYLNASCTFSAGAIASTTGTTITATRLSASTL